MADVVGAGIAVASSVQIRDEELAIRVAFGKGALIIAKALMSQFSS